MILSITLPIITPIFALAIIIPSISVFARRLHDVNRSGWWMLVVVTVVGIIPVIYWAVRGGDQGENRFGPSPL